MAQLRIGRLAGGVAILVCAVCLTAVAPALAAGGPGSQASTAKAKKRHRVGGRVTLAWPHSKKGRPADPLSQWLARQSGPACPKHRKKSRCAKLRGGKKRNGAKASEAVAIPSLDRGPRRLDADPVARIAADQTLATPLALTRSYEIPSGDPSYNRLLNWSWTYDSAVTAASFVATGDQKQATQLLDQLSALQYKDGSIDIAFDVSTGQGAGTFRAGTIAWVGLAATKYDSKFGVSTYQAMAKKTADYLLALQGPSGLIKGGPRLEWYSTQHNLLAYTFLAHLATELKAAGDTAGSEKYGSAATTIAAAIQSNLVTGTGANTHFIQGLGDTVQPLDVQAYGALFELATGDSQSAKKVLGYAKSNFLVTGRSVAKSTDTATYNNTYAAAGPFSGYKPYQGDVGPNVLWFEATPMLRLVTAAVGDSTTTLDSWITSWKAIAGSSVGPLQANQTLTNAAIGVEYHVWPAASPAAWVLLSQNAPTFFTAY
ncbi:MAG TPA: hypothetical protein VHU24_01920 [Solirubrobacterales bacterium]|nr:hypothetical protein [Solirubrobacterales bacterium]